MDDAVRAVALDGVGDRDDLAGCQQQPAAVAGLAAAGGVEDGTVGLEAALVDGGDHRVAVFQIGIFAERSEEHTSELQSLMRISYAVFCLKKKKKTKVQT